MPTLLTCDACHVSTGPFPTYEAWEDAARCLGWWVGESEVLCAICSGNAGGRV